jgi:hypothetical protein
MIRKSYNFQDNFDFIFYLGELIAEVIRNLTRLERYCNELAKIIEDKPQVKFIESSLYEALGDKTKLIICDLFNLISDNKAMSYQNFRNKLEKNKRGIKFENLNKVENDILKYFHSLRNWRLHHPESIINSKKERLKKDSNFIVNPLIVLTYKNYEIGFLKNLERDGREVIDKVNLILRRMKDDYSIIIGRELNIVEIAEVNKPFDEIMKLVEPSYDIQMEAHNKEYNQKPGKQETQGS